MRRVLWQVATVAAAVAIAACGKSQGPGVATLRESFATQLAANQFIKDFQRNGDELTFSGPTAGGGEAKWRVHIDSAVIEPNDEPAQPYKGVVNSSWYADNQSIRPRGQNSGLPLELTDNGLAQICWAFWDREAKRWSWE